MLAMSGEDEVLRALERIQKNLPQDTLLNFVVIPTAKAAREVRAGNGAKAIELLNGVKPFEPSYASLPAIYTRGLAYLQTNSGREAADRVSKDSRSPRRRSAVSSLSVVPSWPRARLHARGRPLQRSQVVPGLFWNLERCGSRHPRPRSGKRGIRQALRELTFSRARWRARTRLRHIQRVNPVLELARRVRVPPSHTKEERDAKDDNRDQLAGRATLERAAEDCQGHSRHERQQKAPTVFRQIALTYQFGAVELAAVGSTQSHRWRRQALFAIAVRDIHQRRH